MCRLLCVRGEQAFSIAPHLEALAEIARDSHEYQGHGWGCAWLEGGAWMLYRDLMPVWEDDHRRFGRTTLLLAHARSAFKDEGICIENNMPFHDGEHVFVFNGELRGVRIKEQGRIGAEKVFNYVKRFDQGDMLIAVRRGVRVIDRRSRYIRAMNFMLASTRRVYLCSLFNEDPGYFQMHRKRGGGLHIVCSQPYPGEGGWQPVDNGATEAF